MRRMRLRTPAVLATLFLFAAALGGRGSEGEPLRFVLLHTNDLHGQMLPREATWLDRQSPPRVGGFATIAAYVRDVREQGKRERFSVILVDAGDWFQGTPEGNRTKGAAVVGWMNLVGYEAATLGNHEFDFGLGNLRSLLSLAKFPVLAANVFDAKTGAPMRGLRPHAVVERSGVRFAFVGILTDATSEITIAGATEGLRFGDEVETARSAVAAARREADLVFLLTHCGLESDRALAAALPEVPLIVGGHSHKVLPQGERNGKTLLVQAGSKGGSIGRVELAIDPETKAIRSASARLDDLLVDKFGEDLESSKLVARETEAVRVEIDAPVGVLLESLGRTTGLRSSSAGNLIADATREAAGAEIAFANKGGLRTALPAGPVTKRSFFELVPFENTIVSFTMTGAEIEEVLRASVRGDGRSPLEVSGLLVRWREREGRKAQFLGAEVSGKPLEASRGYRVAVNSFLAGGGDRYPQFQKGRDSKDTGILLRDAAVEWVRKRSPYRPPVEDRFVRIP